MYTLLSCITQAFDTLMVSPITSQATWLPLLKKSDFLNEIQSNFHQVFTQDGGILKLDLLSQDTKYAEKYQIQSAQDDSRIWKIRILTSDSN